MVATSRIGECLSRRSLMGTEESPSKVDENKILARPKNLAKTVITVQTKAFGGEALVAQRAATLNHGRLQFHHPLRQGWTSDGSVLNCFAATARFARPDCAWIEIPRGDGAGWRVPGQNPY
jgi:hypothetical protein